MVVLSSIHINNLVDGRCGPMSWGLGDVLTTPYLKNIPRDETVTIRRIAHGLSNSSDRKLYLFYQGKYQISITY